jgi:RNA polymerase sigma-70 factor (ECF subfamily)
VERWEDEPQLVQQAQAGNQQAFEALVDRYWGRVCRWLVGLTHEDQLAEDLTQEAFLKAWKALPTFHIGGNFRVWLFAIARHCLVDHQRGSRATPAQLPPEALASKEPGPVNAALQQEGASLLRQACVRLPAHFRSAFLLWSQEGLSFAGVAQVLGLTEETARWRVFKARLLLVKELGAYLDRKVP